MLEIMKFYYDVNSNGGISYEINCDMLYLIIYKSYIFAKNINAYPEFAKLYHSWVMISIIL